MTSAVSRAHNLCAADAAVPRVAGTTGLGALTMLGAHVWAEPQPLTGADLTKVPLLTHAGTVDTHAVLRTHVALGVLGAYLFVTSRARVVGLAEAAAVDLEPVHALGCKTDLDVARGPTEPLVALADPAAAGSFGKANTVTAAVA